MSMDQDKVKKFFDGLEAAGIDPEERYVGIGRWTDELVIRERKIALDSEFTPAQLHTIARLFDEIYPPEVVPEPVGAQPVLPITLCPHCVAHGRPCKDCWG